VSVLEVRGCSIRFGGVQAARDVSLKAGEWEIVGVIGPNGAGKTTTFDIITGFYRPDEGSVWFKGRDVTRLEVHERSMGGIRLGVRAPVLEAVGPVLRRISPERIDVRDFIGIELGPEPTFTTKMRDAALHRDAGARKGQAGARVADQAGGPIQERIG